MTRNFERVRETMQTTTLPNGLRIYYIPKPAFSKTFAMLATDFGSVDSSFTMEDGTHIDTPAGVAHFLEHKMFEDEDGNALQKFAATGASPNAFTSHNMTAYYFSCTSGFEENLTILTKFVFTPYFTEENVAKEKGIIGQEIGMMDDTPFWRNFVGVYQGLYHEHPVRTSISGSVDSIAPITPALLHQCHRAFYSPANMVLVVCGTADFDTIAVIAEKYSPQEAAHIAARHYGTRRDEICQSECIHRMSVSQPTFLLGFKDIPLQPGESRLRRQLLGELCCRILAGETSPLYAALYETRLINRQFTNGYYLHPEAACAMFGGDSRDPRTARRQIETAVKKFAENGVDSALFTRMKRAAYGMTLRTLDQPDEICRCQCEAAFGGEDFPSFAELYDTISAQDVRQMFIHWAQPHHSSMSVVLPRTEAKEDKQWNM
jgi:predicted Zn-dependent peptidase